MPAEGLVLGQLQIAHALKNTQLTVMRVQNAPTGKSSIQTITRDAFQKYVTNKVRSSPRKTNAGVVISAHPDLNQIHPEVRAIESRQNVSGMKSMTQWVMAAFDAHNIIKPLTTIKDVLRLYALVTKFL